MRTLTRKFSAVALALCLLIPGQWSGALDETFPRNNASSITTGTLGVAQGGTGTSTAFTQGSVIFAGASGVYSQDNTNLFWNDSSNFFGLGTSSPNSLLHVSSGTVNIVGTNASLYMNSNNTNLVATLVSGNAAKYSELIFGRGSNDADIAMVGTDGGFFTENLAGDLLLRNVTAGSRTVLGYNTGSKMMLVADGANNQVVLSSTTLKLIGNSSAGIQILGIGSDSDPFVIGTSSMIVKNATGNVGIGTANPTQKVHVSSGTLLLDGNSLAFNMQGNSANISNTWTSGNAANYVETCLGNGTSSGQCWGINDSGTQLNSNAASGDAVFRTITANKKMVFAYNPTGRIGLSYDGVNDRVAIGNTSATTSLTVTATGTTPAATFSPNLSSSTISGALSGTFTNTALGPCISGSTITLNIPIAQPIQVAFHGSIRNDTLAAKLVAGLLVDGAFISGESATKGLITATEHVANDNDNMSFSRIVTGLSAGSHNVCLTAFVSAGTGTIDSTDSDARIYMYMLP